MPCHAWSTTAPTAASSFRHGMTTETCGGAACNVDACTLESMPPGATLIIGGLLQFAGGALAEPVVSLLYAASIIAWFVTARIFSTRAALLTTLVLLLYPGYGILFHELGSDAIFAAAFAGWSLLLVRALVAPSAARFAWAGAGVGVLSLIRPGNQVLLVLALLPLVLRASWRTSLVSTAAYVVPAIVLLG